MRYIIKATKRGLLEKKYVACTASIRGVPANGEIMYCINLFNIIQVTQFDCQDVDNGGPSGCLQYFSAAEGLVSSYNYPIGAAAVVNTAQADGTTCKRAL